MGVEENKTIICRYYESTGQEEVTNLIRQAENPAAEAEKMLTVALAEFYSPDCVIHYPEGDKSIDEDRRTLAMQMAAFPE